MQFKVFVDGELQFDSGVMKQASPAKPVSIDVTGKREMRLVVADAGDGIICDCADWLEARLTRSAQPARLSPTEVLDIAPFAEVVASDPARMEGCKSNRIQEFRAEDLYMDTPLRPNADGVYVVKGTSDKPGSIGLKWLERRRVRALGFEPAGGEVAAEKIAVQCWQGESAWQGAGSRCGASGPTRARPGFSARTGAACRQHAGARARFASSSRKILP